MTALNMQMMPASMPLDFLPVHPHSRSSSVSSSSAHSSNSRPQSSHGGFHASMAPSADDLYRASYHLNHPSSIHGDHSPPNHSISKGPMRPTHIRARAAASPYPRDTDSVHSSSSETDDISMYLGNTAADYHGMFGGGQTMAPSHETMHAAGAFGRMTLSPDHALEKLAANVRVATTTSASDRAKQIFVQAWLTANYAPYPDGNVPRQGLYFSYRRVCDQYGIPHINTATLGKAIRLCFPTIKTRRLGVRGNSKYHYCGIRPATSAEAEWLQDYIHKSNNNAAQSSINAARAAQEQSDAVNRSEERSDEDDDEDSEGATSAVASKRNSLTLSNDVKTAAFTNDLSDKTPTAATLLSQVQSARRPPSTFPPQASIRRHPQQEPTLSVQSHSPQPTSGPSPYLAPQHPLSVRQFPHFPSIEDAVGASSTHHTVLAREVWGWFQDHLDALLESVRSFRFDQFEMHLRSFWTTLGGQHREIVHAPAIAGLMAKADAIVYDEILEFLRLQMLSPLSAASLSSLRQLANKMEKILLAALENYGNTFVEPKVELGARFGHLVLRFLDIYQVTQALNTVLTNQKQLAEMRRSWHKVDFESVRNQSALVCNCRHEDLVQLLEVEFVQMLDSLTKTNEPVREVMAWADKCCERLMGPNRANHNGQEERSTMSSRSVLIRWGYVTSQVMRDLTIRSDPAFGAFQIMKLFLDDWIAVNVLRSVALSTNSVAASVEPVMQQQFFTLSPMAGQESFNSLDGRPQQQMMAHTPTTSSMLAALQNDPFPSGPLDPSSSAFNSDAYGPLSYMDTSVPQDDSNPSGLPFTDFSGSGNSFDVTNFASQDLGINSSATPGSEPEADPEPIKTEQPSGV
ncbi:putative RFX DNA-binding domain containing protein [Lyophyllum shimeji]|uniref:RFX DNA-binding domain containing protein n=1 Tax=Lyophyllum shimeji TaxID=47721 RepID=A0A9P3UI15_LYOSH|nr:putative RFX DNA-binding domain containing protein [Lyophyllum shimeji]